MSTNNTDCIEVCNGLLRGELSAIETYNQALEKFDGQPEAVQLRQIKDEHILSATTLEQNIIKMGGKPDKDSGAWGTFAKTIQGSAKLLGDEAAIGALSQGEKIGKNDYEKALENECVMDDCKTLIRSELLPKQIKHIAQLDKLH